MLYLEITKGDIVLYLKSRMSPFAFPFCFSPFAFLPFCFSLNPDRYSALSVRTREVKAL